MINNIRRNFKNLVSHEKLRISYNRKLIFNLAENCQKYNIFAILFINMKIVWSQI